MLLVRDLGWGKGGCVTALQAHLPLELQPQLMCSDIPDVVTDYWFWPDQYRRHPAGLIVALLSKATQWIKQAPFNPKCYWVTKNLSGKCKDTCWQSSSRKTKEVNMCSQIFGNHFLSHLPESSRIGASGPGLSINTWNENWLMIRSMGEM